MKRMLGTKQENARLDEFVDRLAYYYGLRDWYDWLLREHRSNNWIRRHLLGNRLYDRTLIRRIRRINHQLATLSLDAL